jgi:hypothetical protein
MGIDRPNHIGLLEPGQTQFLAIEHGRLVENEFLPPDTASTTTQ